MRSFVIARDLKRKRILLGGLGGLGVGQMWFDDDGSYKKYPGYKNCQYVDTDDSLKPFG